MKPAVVGRALDVVAVPDEGLGNTAWLVGVGDGRALVVDPARDPGPYLAEAERLGWRIAYTAETHLHADAPPVPVEGGVRSHSA